MSFSRLACPANPRDAVRPGHDPGSHRPAGVPDSLSRRAAWRFLAVALAFCLVALAASALALDLAWNPNLEPGVTGYEVGYGTSPGSRATTITVGTTPSAALTGLLPGTTYYFAVRAVNSSGVKSAYSTEISHQTQAAADPGPLIPQSSWSLVSVDSEETAAYPASHAFDGNPATFWHTAFSSGTTGHPHEIRINLGAIRPIRGFLYLPRQDSLRIGNIISYEFLTSLDGNTWSMAASGNFADSQAEKEVLFTGRNARYVALRSLSSFDGTPDTNIAELNLIEGAVTEPPPNNPPVAHAASVATAEDTAKTITLSATDADGNPLTYQIVTQPAKGALSGTPPNLTYTPQADYHGADSFSFRANDGFANSNPATISITVTPVNDAPVANAASITTAKNTPQAVTLTATDKDNTSLTYQIVTQPAKGALSGTPPNLTYTPQADYHGADSFTFRANDGSANSNSATISITVTSGGGPGLINRGGWTLVSVSSEEPASNPATAAFDGNASSFWHTQWKTAGSPLPHEIVISLGAAHSVEGFRYLPRQDGFLVGNIAQFEFFTSMDGASWGTAAATGTFANNSTPKQITFSPRNARFIRLRALSEANGSIHAAIAELELLGGAPANRAPVAFPATLDTPREQAIALTLTASDADNDPLVYRISTPPSSGTLSGSAPHLTYTPHSGFTGRDSFTFTASDGIAASSPATVTIDVRATGRENENRPPVFRANPLIVTAAVGNRSYRNTIAANASDPDGDSLTFRKLGGPSWLVVSSGGSLGGTPPSRSAGIHRFTIRVSDPHGASATTLLVISIDPPPLPPQWKGATIGGNAAKANIDYANGSYRLRAAGQLSGRRDSGAFAARPLIGDGQIIARVTSMKNAGTNTRAGLMIRDSLNPGSRHVFVGLNGKGDPRLIRRTNQSPSRMKAPAREKKRHLWLKLVRTGNTITAYTSSNAKKWTKVGATTAKFGRNCHIGLYVAGGKGKTSTASFRNVRVIP